jgi:hypothetical protein
MSAEKPVKHTKAGRASERDGGATAEPEAGQLPGSERRYVDVDPWAMLLEQLKEVPEEQPAEGESVEGHEGELTRTIHGPLVRPEGRYRLLRPKRLLRLGSGNPGE